MTQAVGVAWEGSRRRSRPRTIIIIGKVIRHMITLGVAGIALTASGTLGPTSPNLADLIRTSLDAHPGFGDFRFDVR